jgi:MauM/NapG family ferredoxin protein
VAACNFTAISFEFESPLTKPTEAKLDLSKRALLASGVGGLGTLLTFRLTPEAQARVYNPDLIRPPGSGPERDFLQRCIQCGLCMKTCPTNAIQPATFEAGLEGLWTPVMNARIGYCEYECNLCGQVCPTQAIEPLALEEKKKVKIGLATFDKTRCLPYAYHRDCIVCEEHCPISPKAIFAIETEVTMRDGGTQVVKQPHVDPDLCIGCGICANVCVFNDRPAIRVTSANETRHPDNQPVLAGIGGGDSDLGGEESSSASDDPYG